MPLFFQTLISVGISMVCIALDGIDGAGKTTVAEILKEKTNGIIIKDSPPEFFSLIRHTVESNAEKHIGTYFVYHLAAATYAYIKAKLYLWKNPEGTVILDRSLLSVFAVQLALDDLFNKGATHAFIKNIAFEIIGKLSKVDIAAFLDVEEKDRLLRLSKRGDTEALSDKYLRFSALLRRSFEELIPAEDPAKVIKINTSQHTQEEIAEMISCNLIKMSNKP